MAQEDRPQIVPQRNRPQENKKPKKGKEPRAVGILELNSSGKGTLVPVAILIDGRFYDATVYKADPVPMALESGTVYEAEEAGDSRGLFTINGALHSKSTGSAKPWVGTGTYLPKGTEAPKTTRKAEDVPVGLDDSGGDEPPRLTRKDASKPAAGSDSSSGSAPGSGSAEKPSGTAPASQPASGSSTGSNPGQEAPKAGNGPATDKPGDSGAKQPAPGVQPDSDKGAHPSPTESSPGQSSPGQSSPGQSSAGQSSGDYYRPQLRRGKPTEVAPTNEDDRAMAKKKGDKEDAATAASPASIGPLRMVAAISDAGGPDPQSYKFFWKNGEEEERRNQMLAVAGDEVKAYATALAKNQISARPMTPKAGAGSRRAQTKQVQPVFENVQFRGFDVWLTNQPVMVLSAEAHLPIPGGAAAPVTEPYRVTLVARTDIYGNLKKLYSGVTDKFHLDVTPRLELIDVVDADGDGRAELLFRNTTDAGSGYVIYRATADKLWKMFDSLNAE